MMRPTKLATIVATIVLSTAGLFAPTLSAAAIAPPTADERYRALQRLVDQAQGRSLVPDGPADLQAVASGSWLIGIYEILGVNGVQHTEPGICDAKNADAATIAKIYLNYLDSHPAFHNSPATAIAILSAEQAYPCKPKP